MSRKRTHEEFVDLMAEKHPTICVVGKYVNSVTPVALSCNVCGHNWETKPPKSLIGHGCPKCGGSLKLTHEIFMDRIRSLKSNYEVLDKYQTALTPVACRCLIDGHEWTATPNDLMHGKSCPQCAGNIQKTQEQFEEELKAALPDVEVLGSYVNARTPILVRCTVDGYEWSSAPTSLLRGHGCSKCASNYSWSVDEFLEYMAQYRPDIEVLSRYINMSEDVVCRCKIDGCVWTTNATQLKNSLKYGCPKCARVKQWTHQEFVDAVHVVHPTISITTQYHSAHVEVEYRCEECGREWSKRPSTLLRGIGCPKCHPPKSKGEMRISQYLKNLSIDFEPQYRFADCIDLKALPFDFYLPSKNIAIEYDGQHHFAPVPFGGMEHNANLNFKTTVEHDNIKDLYCKNHDITLIRIPYTEFENIETILDKHLL